MIINIRITDEAIKYLRQYIPFPDQATDEEEIEEAEEVGQMFINLCDKSATSREEVIDGSKPIGYRLRRAARDLIEYRRRAGINGDMEELDRIHALERAVEEAEVSRGGGDEMRLSHLERVARKLIQVRKAVSTHEDFFMLDKYINEIETLLEMGEES